MFGKILELLSVNTNLPASVPYILRLLSTLAVIMLLGAFGAALASLLVGFGLFLAYTQLCAAGFPIPGAAAAVAAITLLILVIVMICVRVLWTRIQGDLYQIVDLNTPPAAQAVNRVTSVAGSFLTALFKARRRQKAG